MNYKQSYSLLAILLFTTVFSINSHARTFGAEEPADSLDFKLTPGIDVKDEKTCVFHAESNWCEVCLGEEQSPCSDSTAYSASDCLANCEPRSTEDYCQYNSKGVCKAFYWDDGKGVTVGSSASSHEDCLDHCASVGVDVD